LIKHARIFSGRGADDLTPEQLKEKGLKEFIAAVDTMTFSFVREDEFDEGDVVEHCLPESKLQNEGLVAKISDVVLADVVKAQMEENFTTSLVSFLATRGTFHKNRFWILAFEDTVTYKGNECYLYVSMPEMSMVGNKGSLSIGFATEISKFIAAGGESALLNYAKRMSIPVKPETRKFMFPKAMHADGFPSDQLAVFVADIDLLMDFMKHPVKKNKLEKDDMKLLNFFYKA
jgi:hypothetical protein